MYNCAAVTATGACVALRGTAPPSVRVQASGLGKTLLKRLPHEGVSRYSSVMIASLEEIRDRIVSSMHPDSIILFGSRSRGEESSSSDVDILIVNDTPERPIDRRMAAERLLVDRALPLDIFVYTPQEMRKLHAQGSPFIREVVETGKVVYMRTSTEVWLRELMTTRALLDRS
jgi:predicted nucleotidyltransferase